MLLQPSSERANKGLKDTQQSFPELGFLGGFQEDYPDSFAAWRVWGERVQMRMLQVQEYSHHHSLIHNHTRSLTHTVSQQSHTTLKTYNVPHSWAETHPFLTKT